MQPMPLLTGLPVATASAALAVPPARTRIHDRVCDRDSATGSPPESPSRSRPPAAIRSPPSRRIARAACGSCAFRDRGPGLGRPGHRLERAERRRAAVDLQPNRPPQKLREAVEARGLRHGIAAAADAAVEVIGHDDQHVGPASRWVGDRLASHALNDTGPHVGAPRTSPATPLRASPARSTDRGSCGASCRCPPRPCPA